ncbi:class I SAM-dependent methyltransferase [Streptomyces sp. SBT349]|uniref:class I SAM-dependent methyltransferase n=1 Tax=Streptomyces sp. SBT349 TaxID=1580539 RepID=UPI00066C01BB|nr:class I SAM-dependent methyltransferase [Streptomyces sp. SBT349]
MTGQHHAHQPTHPHQPTQPTHAHDHGHGADDVDWEAMADQLERGGELHVPAVTAAAAWLRERMPAPRLVLDVGSGPGVGSCVLAAAFPKAEVVAVDGADGLLARAATRAAERGLDRVRTHRADLPEGLGGLGPADLVWTSRFVHHVGDQAAALAALAGVLRPGGLLAVVEGGLPARFLPRDIGLGRPGLQPRLDAGNDEWFDEMRAGLPGAVAAVEDWPALLAGAGLVPTGTRTFLADHPAPLGMDARRYLHGHLTRLRGAAEGRLAPDDLATLDALLDPDAPGGVLARPDAFYLAADTVHTAVTPLPG